MAENTPAHIRRLRLTPDRFVVGLFGLEIVLMLSEWRGWFALNQHKGWTMLIGCAVLAVAVLVLLLWFAGSLALRRPFQFGLRTLLLFVLICAGQCSWFAVQMNAARQQKAAIAALRKFPGGTEYDYEFVTPRQETPTWPWLCDLFGKDLFADVDFVCLGGGKRFRDSTMMHFASFPKLKVLRLCSVSISNAGLPWLSRLSRLEELDVSDTEVSGAGLTYLSGLAHLKSLRLDDTKVDDAGLANLQALPQLEELSLFGTQITDAGLKYLAALTKLRDLELGGTRISDEGLRCLARLPALEQISLCETAIGDAGLEHLKALPALMELRLNHTRITNAGMRTLATFTNLKSVALNGTKVGDEGLHALHTLHQLENLELHGTQVSEAAVREFRAALPSCHVTR